MAQALKKDATAPADNGIPAGDSPPKPRWPLLLAAAAWGMWLVFMIVMMAVRVHEAPRLK